MFEKTKIARRRPMFHGVRNLMMCFLVGLALVTGFSNNPLEELLRLSLATPDPVSADSAEHEPSPLLSLVDSTTNGYKIKSIIQGKMSIELLSISVADSIRVEYLLMPRDVLPSIEVHYDHLLALTCFIRRDGPTRRPVIFAGVARLSDETGDIMHRSRFETKLSTLAFNLIDCSRASVASDLDWHALSDYHRTFPIPIGYSARN